MRIGLYGLPCAGKTHILDRIGFLDVLVGSRLLREYDPNFDTRDEKGREKDRKDVAILTSQRDRFIMDGHYAFGDEIAFTEEEGQMYDRYLYLYVDPAIIRKRMEVSTKNSRFLSCNLAQWQKKEISALRSYCHSHDKDFYVLDDPPENASGDVAENLAFVKSVADGYSCVRYAQEIADSILRISCDEWVTLLDGDRTVARVDTSREFFQYKTNIFNGNWYTGFQAWRQAKDFEGYRVSSELALNVPLNDYILGHIKGDAFILTTGHPTIWKSISERLSIPCFCGNQMAAETKYFVSKFLHNAGKKVAAYGDGMVDYYMLLEADEGHLLTRPDGTLSSSFKGIDLGGMDIVRA